MKQAMITLSLFAILLSSGCDNTSTSSLNEKVNLPEQPSKPIQVQIPNWVGSYKAFIPCDACEKKLVSLRLYQDKTYLLKEISFFKQKIKQKESSGTFTFDEKNSNLLQLSDDKTKKNRYFSLHQHSIELLDQTRNRFKNFEKYQIPQVQNIEVNNALKHVDIQADLYKSEKIESNDIASTKLTYFFEINNHSDRPLKLRDSDIVLVDTKNNEHIATFENSPISPIKANKTQHELISFIYPESYQAAYINIK
ncbi:copper resistance protein NlpE N-terminal domain-containing protein [Acinetobacter sp. TSRC1-2]|uniref:copper resistance protein NlpE N-terminal domain-containing protein n=1 Tax=unclassified Acinetobacter TaxID=196816 RepID=UPI003CF31E8F